MNAIPPQTSPAGKGTDATKPNPYAATYKDLTGGPAFPSEEICSTITGHIHHNGMSLRDWFAGMVLQGIYASCPEGLRVETILGDSINAWAEVAFRQADAVLKIRSGK